MVLAEPIAVSLEVTEVLDRLRIRHAIGGSVASSIYGVPRSTHDVDLVAEIEPHHIRPLTAALASRFHIDPDLVAEAVSRRTSFNVIHLETMMKVDVFVSTGSPFHRQEMERLSSRSSSARYWRRLPMPTDATRPTTGASDTHPRMRRFQDEGYRRMSPERKLALVRQLNLGVQQLALARIAAAYPDAPPRELRLRLASLRLGRATMIRVFGWDPRERGS